MFRLLVGVCVLCVTCYAAERPGLGGSYGGAKPMAAGIPQANLASLSAMLGGLPQAGLGALGAAGLGALPGASAAAGFPGLGHAAASAGLYGGAGSALPFGKMPAVLPVPVPAAPIQLPFLTKIKILTLPQLPKMPKMPKLPSLLPSMDMLSLLDKPKKHKKVPVVPDSYSPPAMTGYVQHPPMDFRPLPDIAVYLPSEASYIAPAPHGYSGPRPSYPVADPRPSSPVY